MKKFLLALLGICCGASLFAAPHGSSTPKGWYDDFAAAQAEAKKTNRPILLLLTGSDWCPWCVRLKKNALDKDDFKAFAKQKLILVYADFPNNIKLPEELAAQNERLAKKYGVRGFPTTLILSPDGNVLGKIGGYAKDYLDRVGKIVDAAK